MFRILFPLTVLLFFTACSTTQSPKPKALETKPSKPLLYECLVTQKYFSIDDEKILRIDKKHYLIYRDTEEPPIEFGTLLKEPTGVRFKSKKRDIFVQLDGNCSTIKLIHPQGDMTLKAIYEPLSFYEAKNIFEAIKFGTIEDIKRLRALGISYEVVNDYGSYPLIEAVYYNRPKMLRYMIEDGANIEAENGYGYTALHQAIAMDNTKLIKLLLHLGAKKLFRPCDSLLEAMKKSKDFSTITLLLDAGFNPNCQQSSLLFWTLTNAQYLPKAQAHENLKKLLHYSIKTDVISNELGDTPLMRAAAIGDAVNLKALIDYGVNLEATDRFGRTALDYDSLYLSKKNPKIAHILKAAGLNTGIKATADKRYREAKNLYEKGAYKKAYNAFVALSDQYKQKRFYVGRIKAAAKLKHPSFKILQDLIATYAYLYNDRSQSFYLTLISYYKKMLKVAKDDQRRDQNGNFKPDSVYAIRFKIDELYNKALHKAYTTSIAYAKLQNLYKLKPFVTFKRIDITNDEGSRYVGESLDGTHPFGRGAIKYKNGGKYIGSVIRFVRHGKGKMIYPDGLIYDGDWLDDKRHGNGFFTDENNAMYLGKFIDDTLTGEAKLVRKGR